MRPFHFSFALLVAVTSQAQIGLLEDSTHTLRFMSELHLDMGGQRSMDGFVPAIGAGAGMLLQERFFVGLYGELLTNASDRTEVLIGDTACKGRIFLGHVGLSVLYPFATRRAVHPFLGLRAGWGWAAWGFGGSGKEGGPSARDPIYDGVVVFAPCGGVEWNVGRRFHPSIRFGYRMVCDLVLPDTSPADLNGAFVGITILFDPFSD